ncbi:tRNA pseudouridine(55) synthase TruB [Pelosinus sp. sgz500959]|uniref:tRNA pseudouridine(55) synthase TruB n=1 Tax=Pelosinus sp. sgz500959 TaxID=3242472 RepID=UPI00366C68DC
MTGGLINILKPPGMTSHDVVSFVRRTYHLKRVGHAGTLDPAAAGVLPVALGPATRMLEYMTDCDKSYRVELTIGYETDTGDDTGTITHSIDCIMPAQSQIEEVLSSFLGTIEQVPPMYSAIKIQGKKLYELARAGITVERQARKITIHEINLLKVNEKSILFDVTCSKGTYIRSLCTDIGAKINCPVVMSFLVRTRVGSFEIGQAVTLEEISTNSESAILPVDHALEYMPKIILSQEVAKAFKHGQTIPTTMSDEGGQNLLRIYDHEDVLIGIGQKKEKAAVIIPIKVLMSGQP